MLNDVFKYAWKKITGAGIDPHHLVQYNHEGECITLAMCTNVLCQEPLVFHSKPDADPKVCDSKYHVTPMGKIQLDETLEKLPGASALLNSCKSTYISENASEVTST